MPRGWASLRRRCGGRRGPPPVCSQCRPSRSSRSRHCLRSNTNPPCSTPYGPGSSSGALVRERARCAASAPISRSCSKRFRTGWSLPRPALRRRPRRPEVRLDFCDDVGVGRGKVPLLVAVRVEIVELQRRVLLQPHALPAPHPHGLLESALVELPVEALV